ncbi:MAG: hypothetical protein ABUT39_28100 [Acidobacteriota bacterium]
MSRGLRLAALVAILYVAGVAVWVRYDRRSVREVFEPGSIFNAKDEGLSLAFAYLRERSQAPVSALRRRVSSGQVPSGAVVFRVQASVGPLLPVVEEKEEKDQKEKDEKGGKDRKDDRKDKSEGEKEETRTPLLTPDEEAWMREGGRLVVAFSRFYGPASTRNLVGRQPLRKVFPIWPGVSHVVPPVVRGLDVPALPAAHAVFLAGDSTLILRQPLGQGELILLACPEVLSNKHLGQSGHLALLEALAGVPERRPVLFDERAHGLADSGGVVATLSEWGLGPLLLLGLLATGASFWRASARLGPADREERDTRSDAVELLDSLADLYDRALHRGDAVRLYYESFLHTLAVESGLRGRALDERAAKMLDGFTAPVAGEDLARERFDQALRTINQAFRRVSDAKRDAKRK